MAIKGNEVPKEIKQKFLASLENCSSIDDFKRIVRATTHLGVKQHDVEDIHADAHNEQLLKENKEQVENVFLSLVNDSSNLQEINEIVGATGLSGIFPVLLERNQQALIEQVNKIVMPLVKQCQDWTQMNEVLYPKGLSNLGMRIHAEAKAQNAELLVSTVLDKKLVGSVPYLISSLSPELRQQHERKLFEMVNQTQLEDMSPPEALNEEDHTKWQATQASHGMMLKGEAYGLFHKQMSFKDKVNARLAKSNSVIVFEGKMQGQEQEFEVEQNKDELKKLTPALGNA